MQADYPFELQIVDVGEEPYLAEHFKLVATPALIKIYPEPRQTFAGSDLITQLTNWWVMELFYPYANGLSERTTVKFG